jgi:anti-sigma B factor antagonist
MSSSWNLSISRTHEDGVAIVSVDGRIGTAGAAQLIEALLGLVRTGHIRILLDLGGVDYMSGAGVLSLDAAAGHVHEHGGRLIVCAVCEPVRVVLALAGIADAFTIEPSRAAALELLRL